MFLRKIVLDSRFKDFMSYLFCRAGAATARGSRPEVRAMGHEVVLRTLRYEV